MKVADRVVVVPGGANGIGRALCDDKADQLCAVEAWYATASPDGNRTALSIVTVDVRSRKAIIGLIVSTVGSDTSPSRQGLNGERKDRDQSVYTR